MLLLAALGVAGIPLALCVVVLYVVMLAVRTDEPGKENGAEA